jgi:hypothetical protein
MDKHDPGEDTRNKPGEKTGHFSLLKPSSGLLADYYYMYQRSKQEGILLWTALHHAIYVVYQFR